MHKIKIIIIENIQLNPLNEKREKKVKELKKNIFVRY